MSDYCVICGNIIPEGRMVCIKCELEMLENKQKQNRQNNNLSNKALSILGDAFYI